jgi:hypothetical protein
VSVRASILTRAAQEGEQEGVNQLGKRVVGLRLWEVGAWGGMQSFIPE